MSSAVGPRPPTVKARAGRAAQHAAHLGGDGLEVVAYQHGARDARRRAPSRGGRAGGSWSRARRPAGPRCRPPRSRRVGVDGADRRRGSRGPRCAVRCCDGHRRSFGGSGRRSRSPLAASLEHALGREGYRTRAMRPSLILQHDAQRPPALIGEYLREARFELDVRRLDRGDPLPDAGELDRPRGAHHARRGATRSTTEEDRAVPWPTSASCWPRRWSARCRRWAWAWARSSSAWRAAATSMRAPTCAWAGSRSSSRRATGSSTTSIPGRSSSRGASHTCRLPDDALLLADSEAEPQIFRLGEVAWGVAVPPRGRQASAAGLVRRRGRADRGARIPGGLKQLRKVSRRELLRSAMLCGQLMANFLAAGRVRER